MAEYSVYNPLDYANLAKNVADKLMEAGPYKLPLERFNGAGVYALFYTGEFAPYLPIRSPDARQPIYVGKAVQEGARKGAILDPHSRALTDAISHLRDCLALPSSAVFEDIDE